VCSQRAAETPVLIYPAGALYRKLGVDDYGDERFRKVLTAHCGQDVALGLPENLSVTVAQAALVEIVVSSEAHGSCCKESVQKMSRHVHCV
jgi:hypothetical protein